MLHTHKIGAEHLRSNNKELKKETPHTHKIGAEHLRSDSKELKKETLHTPPLEKGRLGGD